MIKIQGVLIEYIPKRFPAHIGEEILVSYFNGNRIPWIAPDSSIGG
jgi:hypothetical protein